MEKTDREKIERLSERDFEMRRLYQEHQRLDERLKKIGNKKFLTASEEQEERDLKQKKLRGVEKMLTRLRHSVSL